MSRFWSILLTVVLVGSLAANFVGPSKEVEHVWDVKLFFAVYGFVGCVVIIFVSKWLGKYWLQREEEYYEAYRSPPEVGGAEGRSDA